MQAKGKTYYCYSLPLAVRSLGGITHLPEPLKISLEGLLHWQDDNSVTEKDIHALVGRLKNAHINREIAYRLARVPMQDFTDIPVVVDLAAVHEAVKRLDGDTTKANPLSSVDLAIDHSVTVDHFGDGETFGENVHLEVERNYKRYVLLRQGKQASSRFNVMPPGTGICHQINLEYLGKAVWSELQDGEWTAYSDTLVGTGPYTTTINGLDMPGWGTGRIEVEVAMLSQPVPIPISDAAGFKLTGKLHEGITAIDLALTAIQMLCKHDVVGKFVEFCGDGLDSLLLADRATITNMSSEYGAACGFFPIDAVTLDYMRLSGHNEDRVESVEKYAKVQGMWRDPGDEPIFTSTLGLDMNDVEASLAGPKRLWDRVVLPDVPKAFATSNELEASVTHKDC